MERADSVISASRDEPLLLLPGRASAHPNRLSAMLGRVAVRRGPAALVRETAAVQLEERRADWAYSRPVFALDVAWNLAFTVAAIVVLVSSTGERPHAPLRLWIAGYALQCAVHVALVWPEYRRRRGIRAAGGSGRRRGTLGERAPSDSDANDSEMDGEEAWNNSQSSFVKQCESLNTMASFLWWIAGFYWVISGGEVIPQNAPRLYWLTVIFLACDVFFAIFCVTLACVIGIALCCCLPCIIAILYALAGQDGASDADISILPRYKYEEPCADGEKTSADAGKMIPITTPDGGTSNEQSLLREDAHCCICITPYEQGTELHALPCSHHFHSTCIIKWLRINATCPLCKYNILKGCETV